MNMRRLCLVISDEGCVWWWFLSPWRFRQGSFLCRCRPCSGRRDVTLTPLSPAAAAGRSPLWPPCCLRPASVSQVHLQHLYMHLRGRASGPGTMQLLQNWFQDVMVTPCSHPVTEQREFWFCEINLIINLKRKRISLISFHDIVSKPDLIRWIISNIEHILTNLKQWIQILPTKEQDCFIDLQWGHCTTCSFQDLIKWHQLKSVHLLSFSLWLCKNPSHFLLFLAAYDDMDLSEGFFLFLIK